MSPFSLENKLVLITGASSGIGKATSIILSQMGARIIMVGRNQNELEKTKSELAFPEKQHIIAPYDLNDVEGIPTWLASIVKELGCTINAVVYAAGVHQIMPIRYLTGSQLDSIMRINVNAGVQLLKACTLKNIVSSSSSFVFISSVSGIVGEPGVLAYSASKGAVISLARSAAVELAPLNVRVNCIVPGMVESNMSTGIKNQIGEKRFQEIVANHPLGLGEASDVAYAAAYLVSDASRWVTGTQLIVDGGYTSR